MKIIISCCGGVGNVIEASSSIVAIRQLYPSAYITFVYDNYSAEIWRYWKENFLVNECVWVEDLKPSYYDMSISLDNGGPFVHKFNTGVIVSRQHFQAPYHLWSGDCSLSETQLNFTIPAQLGYKGKMPNYFISEEFEVAPANRNGVAIGIGYQKSKVYCDWSKKHWGNDNYTGLIAGLLADGKKVILVGSKEDWNIDGKQIVTNLLRKYIIHNDLINRCGNYKNIFDTVRIINTCSSFIGNETGLMIAAAPLGLNVNIVYPSTKSHPSWKASANVPHTKKLKQFFNSSPTEVINGYI